MPEVQKRDGQGKAESYTESGEEEAKGGENVQKINREDVVQAALTVERWCMEHERDTCDCPLYNKICIGIGKCGLLYGRPNRWNLEEHLRNRGLNNAD